MPHFPDIFIHRYGLKLRGAAANARSDRRVLEGFLIRENGGYGCVQPWPELGDGSLDEQWRSLRSGGSTPLLDRARECAALDGAARRAGTSLFDGIQVPRSHATVTGEADFAALRAEGFREVKLKGGEDWQPVLQRLREAAAAGLRVRLDFNGSLTSAGFLAFTGAAADCREVVDFVEDPVPYGATVWEDLRRKSGWRLALDRTPGEVSGGFDVRVIKPAVMAVPPGSCPAVFTSNTDHPLGQAFAAWVAGCYQGNPAGAGLLTHRLFESDGFTEQLAATGPEWQVPGGTGLGFDELLEALPWIPLHADKNSGSGRVLWNARDPLTKELPALQPGQIGFATSGSTGLPSVAVHTVDSLEASARAVNDWLGAKAEDVWLRVLPGFHVGGYQIGVRAALAGSRVAVEEGKWDAARFVKICQDEGVTLTSLVPAQVVDLVRLGTRAPASLRAVVAGGGALESGVLEQVAALGWPVLPSYGSTEAGSQVATVRPVQLSARSAGEGDPGPRSMVLLPRWEARICADGAADGAGRLELRGPALAAGRFVMAEGKWQWCRLTGEDGWWRTPDRVILSGRSLEFAGRADRVVKVLGELVSLETVETALADAGLTTGSFCVLPVPEERRGAELVLVLVPEAEQDDARLQEILSGYQRMAAPFARLGRTVRVRQLPKSSIGKIRLAAAAALIPPRAVPG